jgi:IclR family transcriptional regulator, acetate operon repressor
MLKEAVKSASRVLDLFEAFARVGKPQILKEVAGMIGAPMSSTSMLVQTLSTRGYLYSPGGGEIYPTRRLLEIARLLSDADPLLPRLRPLLEDLRDATEETVVFSKREGARIVYLDVLESPHPIRFAAKPGETRPLHANTAGKAILAEMSHEELRRVLGEEPFEKLTAHTVANYSDLERDLDVGRARGWFLNDGESVSDLVAIGCAARIGESRFGLALIGPRERMRARLEEHAAALAERAREIAGM